MSTATVTPARQRAGALIDHVVRRFGDRVVLDHLCLTIAGEELVVLLGPSGCGKTALPPCQRQAVRNGICALSDWIFYLLFTITVHFVDALIVYLPRHP